MTVVVMDERDLDLLPDTEKALNNSGVFAEYYFYKEGADDDAFKNVNAHDYDDKQHAYHPSSKVLKNEQRTKSLSAVTLEPLENSSKTPNERAPRSSEILAMLLNIYSIYSALRKTGINTRRQVTAPLVEPRYQQEHYVTRIVDKGNKKLLVDMTWPREGLMRALALEKSIRHLRINPTNWQFCYAANNYVDSLLGADAALIFDSENSLDKGLNTLISYTSLRIIVLNGLDDTSTPKLKKMRPNPSNYIVFGNDESVSGIVTKAQTSKLMTRDSRWILVIEDFGGVTLPQDLSTPITIIKPTDEFCCEMVGRQSGCSCINVDLRKSVVTLSMEKVSAALVETAKLGSITDEQFSKKLDEQLQAHNRLMYNDTVGMYFNMQLNVIKDHNKKKVTVSKLKSVGKWETTLGYIKDPKIKTEDTLKRHLVVGTVLSEPFAFKSDKTDSNGDPIYTGYCIDLLATIADQMKFSYTIKFPDDGKYGVKFKNGTWNGAIGELMRGEIDMIVAGLSMTSEREEVVDFVSPYFDQAGISIVMKRKMDTESLFKFLSVLNWKVWLSMVGAIFVTGLVLWLVDKTSPYSAQNNREKYPNSRIFNMKESFWFALTSFTPQGGSCHLLYKVVPKAILLHIPIENMLLVRY
ncbi:Ionotropic receptor 25a [Nymphon striatum]|nr:Ionotropic receptor 25a [Nymphon striatum]